MRTTIVVWNHFKDLLGVTPVTLYMRDIPATLTSLEELAINRLLKDGKSSFRLLEVIDSDERYSKPKSFMPHDEAVFKAINKSISTDYSLVYSLFANVPTVGSDSNCGRQRCNYDYYKELGNFFLSTMSKKERTLMFSTADLVDMDDFISKFL